MTVTLYEGDYCVRLTNLLPCRVHAQTRLDKTGFYNIYINARLPFHMQVAAFWHEIRHIERGDFWNAVDIRAIEAA